MDTTQNAQNILPVSPVLPTATGKRFVVFQEDEPDEKTQYTGRMMEITGGDWIFKRPLFKHKHERTFKSEKLTGFKKQRSSQINKI